MGENRANQWDRDQIRRLFYERLKQVMNFTMEPVLVKAMIMLLQEDGEKEEAEHLSRKLTEQHQRKLREGTIDNNFILRKEIADIHMKWKEYKNAKKVYLQ